MFKIVSFALPMFLASLFSFFFGEENSYKKNEAMMNKVVESSIKQLSQRYGLIPIGRGGGIKDEKSKREYVAFRVDRNLSKDEARVLIVEIVELFLHNINNNQAIENFLYNKPFTYKNLEFRVFIYNKDGSDTFDPDLGLVSLTREGTVTFVSYQYGSLCKRALDLEEPYEEVYQIATQRAYPQSNKPEF